MRTYRSPGMMALIGAIVLALLASLIFLAALMAHSVRSGSGTVTMNGNGLAAARL